MKKIVCAIALPLLLVQPLPLWAETTSSEGKDKASFSTTEMINTSAPALFDCAHYCIVGIQVRWVYIPPAKIKIFYTPVVRHNTADLITMSAAQTTEMPWSDYSRIFGKNAKQMGDKLIQASTGKSTEVGGGPSQYEGFGKKQSINFKDADVMGNPMAFVVEELDASVAGSQQITQAGTEMVENENDDSPENDGESSELSDEVNQASNEYLTSMGNNDDSTQMSDELYSEMGAEMYKEMVKNNTTVQMWSEVVKEIVDAFADSMSDMVVDFYGCDSFATPFKPFYVSNMDSVLWRDGYPVTDSHKSTTILNPLSEDLIKPSNSDDSAVAKAASSIKGGWGHLYPRAGFVNSAEDYKVGAITAARGLSIASESEKRRVRQYAGGSYDDVFFQQVHPTPSTSCYTNIANSITEEDNNLKRNYAWNGWRRYQCPLTHVGGVLATIIWGDTGICIGEGAKDGS